MPSPRPKRLKVLEDGSLELPLASRVPENGGERTAGEVIVLLEPSMVELARIHDYVRAADEALEEKTRALPDIPPSLQSKLERADALRKAKGNADEVLASVTNEERDVLTERAEVLRDRNRVAFSLDSPHGLALIDVVELLTGRRLEPADLPGWAMHWTVIGEVLARFMDPFAGRAAAMVEEALATANVES